MKKLFMLRRVLRFPVDSLTWSVRTETHPTRPNKQKIKCFEHS